MNGGTEQFICMESLNEVCINEIIDGSRGGDNYE